MDSFDSRDYFRVFIGRWEYRIETKTFSEDKANVKMTNQSKLQFSATLNDNNIFIIINTVPHVAEASVTTFLHEKWK